MFILQLVFWCAAGLIFYTFLGFPILVIWVAKRRPRPVDKRPFFPTVTLLIAAYNEAEIIPKKIENCLAQNYPKEKLTITIVADGSNDSTVGLVEKFANQGIQLFYEPERKGKITAVNRIMPQINSDIVIFSDANAFLKTNTVSVMVENFADENVVAVAGEKQVLGGGEGLYWRYESYLKKKDSEISSVMGAAGELFAIRTDWFIPPEADSIIEDFVLSMRLVSKGKRVVYEPRAIAQEAPTSHFSSDWARRTRIAAGGFQSIMRLPQLWHPKLGIIVWQYVSHRVLRWAVTPFLFPLLLIINLFLLESLFYQITAVFQLLFYSSAFIGYTQARNGKRGGIFNTIFFFCQSNAASIVGLGRYISNSQPVAWQKVR